MAFGLVGARIFDGNGWHEDNAVIVEGRCIIDLVPPDRIPSGIELRQLEGGLLAPGFIDIQVNGGGGALLNNNPDLQTVRHIAEAHRKFGTTGLLPTVVTDAPEIIAAAAAAVKAARDSQKSVLGIHVEGPFLDPVRKGAHDDCFIRAMSEQDANWLAQLDCGSVLVTLAPNKVPPKIVAQLAAAGIIVSLGHSDATIGEAKAALAAGASCFTHLFNAMSQMTGREPGMVGAALADKESFCGIIADGHHVHDSAIRVALAAKPSDRLILVTDAMPAAAGGPDSFELQGRKVTRKEGRLALADGTLAGSNLTMDEAVRHCALQLGVPLADTLRMASLNPAALLRRDHELGRIAPGFLASLVHLSDELQVRQTWIEGR